MGIAGEVYVGAWIFFLCVKCVPFKITPTRVLLKKDRFCSYLEDAGYNVIFSYIYFIKLFHSTVLRIAPWKTSCA